MEDSGVDLTQSVDAVPSKGWPSNHSRTGWESSGAEGKALGDGGRPIGVGRQYHTDPNARKSAAEDWFNTFNCDVGRNQSHPTYENDSPYYMPNHNRKVRHPRVARSHHGGFPDTNAQPGFLRPMGILESMEESNSDSFRSVIDDLTIKNKKLKKRLKKLEALQCTNKQAEKLFEVRVHDLPESKKAELEKILQSFTASLDEHDCSDRMRKLGTPEDRSCALDSGYASVSRSGDSSVQQRISKRNDSVTGWPALQSNSEITKMKLVVGKLEQLFTGTEAGISDRNQLHQQDISALAAAEDDAKELEGGHVESEGSRGASLMAYAGNNQVYDYSDTKESTTPNDDAEKQRPTRPMDLDPQREQVAEENIEYLTHMTGSSLVSPGTNSGWVYLNLIINLAQLHTINVTPPFIKKAIAAVSNRLELSPDGKMVRWRAGGESPPYNDGNGTSGSGGEGVGMQSSDDGSASGQRAEMGGRKPGDHQILQSASGSGRASDEESGSRFHYQPLLARSQSFEDDSSSCLSSDSDSTKRSSSGEPGSRRMDSGPIIYYRGAAFCTDLSSQPFKEEEEEHFNESPTRYIGAIDRPLGSALSVPESPNSKEHSPLYQAGAIPVSDDSMSVGDEGSPFEFSPQFTGESSQPAPPAALIEFEASGIGGILPADNFAIDCRVKHYILPDSQARLPALKSRTLRNKIFHRIPKSSIEAFYNQNMSELTHETEPKISSQPEESNWEKLLTPELLSAYVLRLPPSALPPASYIFTSPSEGSESGSASSSSQTDHEDRLYCPLDGYFFQKRRPIGSVQDVETSVSSVAAAGGDSTTSSSVFEGPSDPDALTEDSEQSGGGDASGSGGNDVDGMALDDEEREWDRPNLKRSSGSVFSSMSRQVRKSARLLGNRGP